jgi:hypothetical protein
MKSKSSHSMNPDSYEAGFEIGKSLADIKPEAIFLLSSIHYDFREIFDGLYDGLGSRDMIIFGGTSDGFYEAACVSNIGVSALGINSYKKISWSVSIQKGWDVDSYEAAQKCMKALLHKMNGRVDIAVVMADLGCDGVKVVEGVRDVFQKPFVGGLTGDDWNFKEGYVFVNGAIYRNSVGILGMSGDFSFALNTASGWKPLGKTGTIEESQGNVVHLIDGKTAFDFLEEQYGIPPAEVALGVIPLAVYESEVSENFFLRAPAKIDMASGKITYFGSIDEGKQVRVCCATEEDVVSGVNEALTGVGAFGFKPKCAFIVSCASRKWILKERISEEINRVFNLVGKTIPLLGFRSFGEIGPFRKPNGAYTNVFFHNESYAILFLGDSE